MALTPFRIAQCLFTASLSLTTVLALEGITAENSTAENSTAESLAVHHLGGSTQITTSILTGSPLIAQDEPEPTPNKKPQRRPEPASDSEEEEETPNRRSPEPEEDPDMPTPTTVSRPVGTLASTDAIH